MLVLDTFSRLTHALRATRARSRTIRAISDLPPEALKDIGWPENYRPHSVRLHR